MKVSQNFIFTCMKSWLNKRIIRDKIKENENTEIQRFILERLVKKTEDKQIKTDTGLEICSRLS